MHLLWAKASALREAGEFDEPIFGREDWDMWRRITQRSSGLHMHCVLVGYRELDHSVSSNARWMLENSRKVLRKSFVANPNLPWHVKLRALSYLHFDAAMEYRHTSAWNAALQLLKSLALWPAPIGSADCGSLIRARFGICLCLL